MTPFKEVKISEIFNIVSGFTFKKNLFTGDFNDIPIIRIQNVSEKNPKFVYYPEDISIDEKFIVNYGDLLLPLSGSFFKLTRWLKYGKYYLNQRIAKLTIKQDLLCALDENFIKVIINIIEKEIFLLGRGSNNNLSMEDIKKIIIKIPVSESGEFDLEKQKEIAQKYEKLEKIKDRIRIMKEDIEEKRVHLSEIFIGQEIPIFRLFHLERGDSKYTRKYGSENQGNYPVFSAGQEQLTSINTYDFDGKYLTWATNGFAGYLKKIDGKFSINSDRGVFIPLAKDIDIDFIRFSIQPDMRNLAKGRVGDKGKNEFTKLSPDKIKESISIKIPTRPDGDFDLEKQKEIAQKYEKIEKMKSDLIQELEYLESVKVEM